ncbi:MAG: DUF882 domain-containing protein [Kofleriaceae bacterium]
MLASIFHLKFATAMMSSWMASASPLPIPAAAIGLALEAHVATPVEVQLVDVNRTGVAASVVVERDGSTDAATATRLAHLFRCRTGREHGLAQRTMVMLADLAERYGKPLEFVSVYRVAAGESPTSPHRDARAIDFRIAGVPLTEIRDYLFRTYTEVGIGWYPYERFIHMDTRPRDTVWTFTNGVNDYHPGWADRREQPVRVRHRPGV